MATHMNSGEAADLPCPVCGAEAALLLMGQRIDDPPWGRRMLGLFSPPHVTRVCLCAVCDEVVLITFGASWRASPMSLMRWK